VSLSTPAPIPAQLKIRWRHHCSLRFVFYQDRHGSIVTRMDQGEKCQPGTPTDSEGSYTRAPCLSDLNLGGKWKGRKATVPVLWAARNRHPCISEQVFACPVKALGVVDNLLCRMKSGNTETKLRVATEWSYSSESMGEIKFSWNPKKAKLNLRDHGISFDQSNPGV